MTEEEVKGLLKEASEKIKEDFIPNMTNLIMDVFQHGINKGIEIGEKIGADKRPFSIKWQTGEPKKEGEYLVVVFGTKIEVDYLFAWDDVKDGRIIKRFSWKENLLRNITAWCKLSDIEPYKEG